MRPAMKRHSNLRDELFWVGFGNEDHRGQVIKIAFLRVFSVFPAQQPSNKS